MALKDYTKQELLEKLKSAKDSSTNNSGWTVDSLREKLQQRWSEREYKQPRQPSPLMQGALDMANPLSKNYVDPFAQKASYDWYSQPESKRSDILSRYAQQAAFDTKYDGMSYADRAAALENLKTNLKNAPNPEQGAEYQYLKRNLEANPLEGAVYRAEQDSERLRRIAQNKAAQQDYTEAFSELVNSNYPAGEYWALSEERDAMRSQGAWDRVNAINEKIDEWIAQVTDPKELELLRAVEQGERTKASTEEDEARHAAYVKEQKAFDEAIGQYYNTENIDKEFFTHPGADIQMSENPASRESLDELKAKFPEYAEEIDDVLYATIYGSGTGQNEGPSDEKGAGASRFANQMTENEWTVFYSLLNKGTASDVNAAFRYLKELRPELAARTKQAATQAWADAINELPFGVRQVGRLAVDAATIGADLVGAPLALAGEMIQTIPEKDANGIPINKYDPYNALSAIYNATDVMKSGASQSVRQDYGGAVGDTLGFLHDALYSAVQSSVGAASAGRAFTFLMGSGAAVSRAEELYQRGASASEIYSGSIAAGVNEALFEYLSLDKLIKTGGINFAKGTKITKDQIAKAAKTLLTQAGVEGSEEIATDVANNLYDAIYLGQNSDINEDIRQIMSAHPDMSYEDAKAQAYRNAGEEVLKSGLAGFISGFASPAAYTGAQAIGNVRADVNLSKNISSQQGVDETVKEGLLHGEDTEAYKAAQEIQRKADAGEKVSDREMGELVRLIGSEKAQAANEARASALEKMNAAADEKAIVSGLTERGMAEDEAKAAVEATQKAIRGEELTDAEADIVDNNAAVNDYVRSAVATFASDIMTATENADYVRRATTRGKGSTKANDYLQRDSKLDQIHDEAMNHELKPVKISEDAVKEANKLNKYTLSESGKTEYNGKEVTIDKAVGRTADGDVIVKLSNGENVALSDVQFGTNDEAILWETLGNIKGITSEALTNLVAQYDASKENVSAGEWAKGVAEGYDIGRSGVLGTPEFAAREGKSDYLHNVSKNAKYVSEREGRYDIRREAKNENITVKRAEANTKKGETKSEQVRRATEILDKLGRKYETVSGMLGDGYIKKDGTIVLNENGTDPVAFVLKHELTHFGENSKYYGDFVDAVKKSKAFGEWLDGQSLKEGTQAQQEAAYVRNIQQRYLKNGVRLTNTAAYNEMIANFVGDTLFTENGSGLEGLLKGMNKESKSRVIRFLKDFIARIKSKLGGRDAQISYLEKLFTELQNTSTGERGEGNYSFTETDKKYLDAVNSGDMETAQRMVDEAAKAAGYDSPKLYHGTRAFGFTQIDTEQSDDRISFFATDNSNVARTYSSNGANIREINEEAEDGYESPMYSDDHMRASDALAEWYDAFDNDEENEDLYDKVRKKLEDALYNIIHSANVQLGVQGYFEYNQGSKAEDLLSYGVGRHEAEDELEDFISSIDGALEDAFGGDQGIYQLYGKLDNFLVINGGKNNWNNIKLANTEGLIEAFNKWWVDEEGHEPSANGAYMASNTRNLAKYAKARGYDGVLYKKIYDTGGYGASNEASDVYNFFDPQSQVKSADPVTYDDKGNVIPLSERFNDKNEDIRYSMPEAAENQSEYTVSEIKKLNDAVSDLKGMLWLQQTETGGAIPQKASIERIADSLMNKYKLYVGKGKLMQEISAAYTQIALMRRNKLSSWADFQEAVKPAVDLMQSLKDYTVANEEAIEILNELRGVKIKLNEGQIGEIKAKDDNLTKWRSKIKDTIKYAPNDPDAMYLVELWREWSERYPDWFSPEITSDAEMAAQIGDIMSDLKAAQETADLTYYTEKDRSEVEDIDALLSEDELEEPSAPGVKAENVRAAANDAWEEDRQNMMADIFRSFANVKPTQTLTDKAEKRYNELKENSEKKLKEVIRAKNDRIAEIKKKNAESRSKNVENRRRTHLRAEIAEAVKELESRLNKPKEGKYVPKDLKSAVYAALSDYYKALVSRSANKTAAIDELRAKYEALMDSDKAAYDPAVLSILKTLRSLSPVKTISQNLDNRDLEMNSVELRNVKNVFRAILHFIQESAKMTDSNFKQEISEIADKAISETRDVHKNNPLAHFNLREATPETAFDMLAGFAKDSAWHQLYKMLNEGQRQMLQIRMEANAMFSDLINNGSGLKRLVSTKKGDLVDVGLKDENGNAVKLTHGMMVSLYMHLLNRQNALHFAIGGLVLPNLEAYYSNNPGKAWDSSRNVTVEGKRREIIESKNRINELAERQEKAESYTQEAEIGKEIQKEYARLNAIVDNYVAQVRAAIENNLTVYDQAWIKRAQDFFDGYAKDVINEATMKRFGFEKAGGENYYPIRVDKNQVAREIDEIVRDFSLEGIGPLKERIKGASNRIYLDDITSVVNRHIGTISRVGGLLNPLHNFSKFYNSYSADGMTVREAIDKAFGKSGLKYIDDLMADLNGARKTKDDWWDNALRALRGNLAKSSLMINPRVAIQQAASYATASYVLDAKSLAKALAFVQKNDGKKRLVFARAEKEAIQKYTPYLWNRMLGYSSVEVGDIRGSNALGQKANKRLAWLTGWITKMDALTVGRLWYASKYYVEAHNPSLEVGSEEFYKTVAAKFEEVIEKTQPVYEAMQRPASLRSTNEIERGLMMFMTQRLQNFNILYSSIQRYNKYAKDFNAREKGNDVGKNGVTEADVKTARKQMVSAITSQMVQGATLVIMKALADFLLHSIKGYKDDDDELTWGSLAERLIKNFIEAEMSNVAFGSELYKSLNYFYDLARGKDSTYYPVSLNGFSSIIDSIDHFHNAVGNLVKYAKAGGESGASALKSSAMKLAKDICQALGLPLDNVKKIADAAISWGKDISSGVLNSSDYPLYSAYVNDDTETAKKLMAEYDSEEKYNNAVAKELRAKDGRIREAAEAMLNGDTKKAQTIEQSIKDEHPMFRTREHIDKAVQLELESLVKVKKEEKEAEKEKEETSPASETSWSDNYEFDAEESGLHYYGNQGLKYYLYDNDLDDAAWNIKESVKAGQKSSAQTAVTNWYSPKYKEAYRNGDTKTMEEIKDAIEKLVEKTKIDDKATIYTGGVDHLLDGWERAVDKEKES